MANDKKYFIDEQAFEQARETRNQSLEAFTRRLLEVKAIQEQRSPQDITDLEVKEMMKTVAPVYKERVQDIVRLTESSMFLKSKDTFKSGADYVEPAEIKAVYGSTGKALFESLHTLNPWSGTNQTGSQLIQRVQAFNQMNYQYTRIRNNNSLASMKSAYDYFKTQNQFMAYDLETLGGNNASGYKTLDTITEFSFQTFDKTRPGEAVSTIENVIGLTDEQADGYLRELSDMESRGARTGRMQVLMNRFGKYGHSDTVLDNVDKGLWKVSSFAADGAEGLTSPENIRRGINRLRQVGAEQRANRLSNGLMAWQDQLAQSIHTMNNGTMPVVGYNDISADIPWLNQFTSKMMNNMTSDEKAAFLTRSGFQNGTTPVIMPNPQRHLDMRTFASAAGEAKGKSSYYLAQDKLGLLQKGMTPFQQETLGRLFFGGEFDKGGAAAHAAGFDVSILSRLVSQDVDKGKSVLDLMMDDALQGASKIQGPIQDQKRTLLLANMAQSYYNGGSDPMSFVHDQMDNSFRTFNGYAVDANGKASKELFGQYGIHRNRFYTLDWAAELDMSSDWVKNMSGLHDEYAQGRLYAAKLDPVFDESVAGMHQGMKSPTYIVMNSMERLEGFMSTFLKVGERSEAAKPWQALRDPEARREVFENLELVSMKDGKLQNFGNTTIDGMINYATKVDMNESAARMVREDSYAKAIKFDRLYNKLKEATGIEDRPLQKKDVQSTLNELINGKAIQLATKTASGQPLTMSFSDVQEILGFKQGNDYKLYRETLDKYTTTFDFLSAQRGVANAITSHIEQAYSKATPEERQFRYEQTLNSLKTSAANELASDPSKIGKFLTENSDSPMMFAKDANYFNFDMSGFYRTQGAQKVGFHYEVPEEENILRVNLNPNKEYGFVGELLRNRTKMTSWNKSEYDLHGVRVLREFVDHTRDTMGEEHPKMFRNLKNIEDYKSADALAEAIQRELINYRKTSRGATAGYITDLSIQNVLQENAAFKFLEQDPAALEKRIGDINSKLPKMNFVNNLSTNDKALEMHATTIVDNILMDELKIDGKKVSANEYASRVAGMDKVQASAWEKVYNMTRAAHIEGITKFTKGLLQTNAELMYDTEQKTIAAMLNGESIALNFAKIRATDGVLYAEVGSNRVGVHAQMFAPKLRPDKNGKKPDVKFSRDMIRVGSTLQDAYDRTFSPIRAFERGHQQGNVLEQVKSYMASLGQNLREGSSVSKLDIADAYTAIRFDYKDLYNALPYMHEAGMFDNVRFRDEGLLDIVKNPKLSYDTMSTTQRETIQKNIPTLLRIATGLPLDDESIPQNDGQFFAKYVSASNKETQVSEGVGITGGFSPKAGWQFDNNSRPVINQATRAVTYRRSDWEAGIKELGRSNLSVGSIFESPSAALQNRTIDGLRAEDNRSATSVRMGKVNMAHAEFQAMIQRDHITRKALTGNSARDQKIMNRLKNINLTEQEKVMDTRVTDALFFRMEEQKVNAKKDLYAGLEANAKTLREIESLRNVMPVMEIKDNGEIAFSYKKGRMVDRLDPILTTVGFDGADQVYGAKSSGRLRYGYFTKTDGHLANEADVLDTIKGSKDITEAYRKLDDKYDAAFFVKQIDQLSYKKLSNGMVEKDMAYSPYFGLGELDEKVSGYLNHTGNEKLSGRVLTKEAIQEELLDGFKANPYFDTKEQLSKAISKERHAASDRIREMFAKIGIEDVSMVANHHIAKHGNVMLGFEEAASTMVELEMKHNRMSEADAVSTVFKKMQQNGKVMGIESVGLKDGKIVMDNVLQGGKDYLDAGAMNDLILSDDLYREKMTYLDNNNQLRIGVGVRSNDGRVIGSYANTVVNEVSDFQGMTAAGGINKLLELDDRIANPRASDNVLQLEADKRERSQVYNAISRGKKISDREIQLLNLQRYDQGVVDVMQSGLESGAMSKGEFESMLGHVLKRDESGAFVQQDGKYLLDEKVKGRSMLESYTGTMGSRMLYDPAAEMRSRLLSPDDLDFSPSKALTKEGIERQYGDESVRREMNQILSYVESQGEKISRNKAEQIYSTGKGLMATRWNDGEITNREAMTGFKATKFSEVANSVGHDADYILKNDKNIFNQNLLMDMGEYAGHNQRHIALPFAPVRLAGQEADSLIKFDFQKKVNVLQRRMEDIGRAERGEIKGLTKDKAIAKYQEGIEELKASIQRNITGKDGVAAQAKSIREAYSINGKSSFATILDPKMMQRYNDEIIRRGGKSGEQFSKGLISDLSQASLQDLNESVLGRATFNGKSLLDHYASGASIDARFVSEEAFERMGYFEKGYMESVGAATRQDMKDILSTRGVMTDTTRYPTIKEGSTKPTMMYLSDDLAGNRTKLTAGGALAAVADNDGDLIASSVMLDRGGRDSLQVEALERAGKNVDNYMWNDAKSYMMYRALGVNQFWDNEAYKTMQEDITNALNNGDFQTITKSRTIDNKIFAEFSVAPSSKGIEANRQIYNAFMQANPGLDESSKTFVDDADKILSGMTDTAARDRYKEALIFENAFSRTEVGAIAKARKLAIGEANIPLFRLRKATELAIGGLNPGDERRRNVLQQTMEIIEQEVISSKKGNVRYYMDKTETFNNALSSLLYGNADTKSKAAGQMRDWLTRNAQAELAAEGRKLVSKNADYGVLPDMGSRSDKEIFTAMSDEFINTVSSFNSTQVRQLRALDNLGSGKNGMSGSAISNMLGSIPESRGLLEDKVIDVLEGSGVLSMKRAESSAFQAKPIQQTLADTAISDGREWLQGQSSTEQLRAIAGKVTESFSEMTKGLDGKTMALGALGLAGAVLVAGFVGGNPSKPAETHAADEAGPVQQPMLMDQDLSATSKPQQSGYVVNMRASSNKSPQYNKDAINGAVSQSLGSNVNISMNITDSTGNINDRYVEQLLSGAIG